MDKDHDGSVTEEEFSAFVFRKTSNLSRSAFDKLLASMRAVCHPQRIASSTCPNQTAKKVEFSDITETTEIPKSDIAETKFKSSAGITNAISAEGPSPLDSTTSDTVAMAAAPELRTNLDSPDHEPFPSSKPLESKPLESKPLSVENHETNAAKTADCNPVDYVATTVTADEAQSESSNPVADNASTEIDTATTGPTRQRRRRGSQIDAVNRPAAEAAVSAFAEGSATSLANEANKRVTPMDTAEISQLPALPVAQTAHVAAATTLDVDASALKPVSEGQAQQEKVPSRRKRERIDAAKALIVSILDIDRKHIWNNNNKKIWKRVPAPTLSSRCQPEP